MSWWTSAHGEGLSTESVGHSRRSTMSAEIALMTADRLQQFFDQPRAFTRAEILAQFSRSALNNALTHGMVARILPGVYAGALHSRSTAVRAHAAQLWSGDGVIGGVSALFEWGLIDDPPRNVHVWIAPDKRLRPPGWITVHRNAVPLASTRRGALTVSTPAFAIVQGLGDLRRDRRADAVYRAVRRRLVGVSQLRSALEKSPRVRARRDLERFIDAAERGAESYLEQHALAKVFNTAEFATLLRQHVIVHEGESFRLDLFDPLTKTAAEMDGEHVHADPAQWRKDIRRDAILATRGILTARYAFRTLIENPAWCRLNFTQILRARGATN